MKFASVRPGTAISRILLGLFYVDDTYTRTLKHNTIQRATRRAARMGLIDIPDMRLMVQGRWYCVALHLGVSIPELAALAGIYAQTKSWSGESRLAAGGTNAFAIRDAGVFAPGTYHTGTIRDIYNRLVMKGLICRGEGCSVVVLPRHIQKRLEPHHTVLMALRDAAREGRRPAGAF